MLPEKLLLLCCRVCMIMRPVILMGVVMDQRRTVMDMLMGMDMAVLMAVDQITVGMNMGMRVYMFMCMLELYCIQGH